MPAIQPDSELAGAGIVITTLLPKRKDGLYGISLDVPKECIDYNSIAQNTATIFTTLEKPEEYIFRITIYDKDLGTHVSTNDARNPLEAFEKAKVTVKKSLVDSAAQDEAMRIEDTEMRILDIAENAAISQRASENFRFQIESVEISCYPASWNFVEKV